MKRDLIKKKKSPFFFFTSACFTLVAVFSFLTPRFRVLSLCLSWKSWFLILTVLRGVKVKSAGASGGTIRFFCRCASCGSGGRRVGGRLLWWWLRLCFWLRRTGLPAPKFWALGFCGCSWCGWRLRCSAACWLWWSFAFFASFSRLSDLSADGNASLFFIFLSLYNLLRVSPNISSSTFARTKSTWAAIFTKTVNLKTVEANCAGASLIVVLYRGFTDHSPVAVCRAHAY